MYKKLHLEMVENYAPPSILLNGDDRIVHLSPGAGRYLVHPGGEPTTTVVKLVREELRLELASALHEARAAGRPQRSRAIPIHLDGVACNITLNIRPRQDPGHSECVLLLFEELRSTLEELKTSKEENLLEATYIATLFLDGTLRVHRFTPRIEQLFHIGASDLGRPLAHLTHRLGYDQLHDDVAGVLKNLEPVEREVEDDGGHCYLTRVLPYRSEGDRIKGVVLTFIDITQRKQTEETLHQSETKVRRLTEAVPNALFSLCPSGKVQCASAQFHTMIGEPPEDVVGTLMWPEFIHPEDRSRADEVWVNALAKRHQFEIRYRLRAPGNSYRWVIVRARPYFDDQNNLTQWFGSITDIHDLTIAEAQIHKLNDSLEVRVAQRTQQLSGLASRLTIAEQEERRRISNILHDDLQQLLHGVQMQLRLMKESLGEKLAQEAKSFLEGSEEWLENSVSLTRQLTVDLSPPILNEEGLAAAIRWMQKQMKELHNLDVEVIADHEFKIENKGLRVLLYQIVRELLFNAAKHAHTQAATVEMKDATDGGILVSVRDEGTGFDVEALEERASERRGFGLFSVRERLDLFEGTLEIKSAPGKGTRIDLRLPPASGFSRRFR